MSGSEQNLIKVQTFFSTGQFNNTKIFSRGILSITHINHNKGDNFDKNLIDSLIRLGPSGSPCLPPINQKLIRENVRSGPNEHGVQMILDKDKRTSNVEFRLVQCPERKLHIK